MARGAQLSADDHHAARRHYGMTYHADTASDFGYLLGVLLALLLEGMDSAQDASPTGSSMPRVITIPTQLINRKAL